MKRYIGIDPGSSGGLVSICDWTDNPIIAKIPESEFDLVATLRCWYEQKVETHTVLEKVGGYIGGGEICKTCWQPKNQSPGSSMFNFGRGVGLIVGCLNTLGVKFQEIEPQRWQKALGLKRPEGMSQDDWKRELKKTAQRLYPGVKVTLAVCDAILLARYARLCVEGYPEAEPLE